MLKKKFGLIRKYAKLPNLGNGGGVRGGRGRGITKI
jgi:hypothetical protein